MEEIKVVDFLCGKCPFEGCWENEDGICLNEDEEFLLNTFDIIRDVCEKDINNIYNKNIKCEPKFDDNVCKYCGALLKYTDDFVPWSDTYVRKREYYCPKCE